MSTACTVFETPIGACGIAWGEAGIVSIQLPERDDAHVRARLRRRFPGITETSPTPAIEEVMRNIGALLRGERADFSAGQLDMQHVPEFAQRVYAVARTIPPGATLSYGQIAARLGAPHLAREVGQALARNPFPIVVPCHRVLAAGGKLGGFSAPGGVATKQRLLEIEHANVSWQLPLVS